MFETLYPLRQNRLMTYVGDQDLIDFFYLDKTLEEVLETTSTLQITPSKDSRDVPFNAQLRDYKAATDQNGCMWIIKKVEPAEVFIHRLFEVAYYLDFLLETLAVPSILFKINETYYRGSKVIKNAINIGSYNYLENPFKKVLTNDLINRWLYFDEDRNPNNYMVLHNSKNNPLVVAIDYNKADLECSEMKITGMEGVFGWERHEKTRFLTLLRPDDFQKLPIENFDYRLTLLMNIPLKGFTELCTRLFQDIVPDPVEKAKIISANFDNRRKYISEYFRKALKPQNLDDVKKKDDEYAGFGKTFMNMYKDKK
jgi:hypothetical protein